MSSATSRDAEKFNYFLWKRHVDPMAWQGFLPELLATDGDRVRQITSHYDHILFQQYEDEFTASAIVERVERAVGRGVALLGYSMFSAAESLAILHTASGLEPGWLAFPQKEGPISQFPTMPIRIASHPRLRIDASAEVVWRGGDYAIRTELRQKGQPLLNPPHAFNILDHIVSWKLHARVGRDDEMQELGLCRHDADIELTRMGPLFSEAIFSIEETILREFSDDPSFGIWLEISFERTLFCLPEEWVSFWLKPELRIDSELRELSVVTED